MKEICIEFAEWVGINTFDGNRMCYEVGKSGISTWRLYNNHNYILSHKLYQKFCDEKGIDFTLLQQGLYWDKMFDPTNFVEFIGNNGLFYLKWSKNGVQQKSYWTTYKNNGLKYDINDLYELFKKQ